MSAGNKYNYRNQASSHLGSYNTLVENLPLFEMAKQQNFTPHLCEIFLLAQLCISAYTLAPSYLVLGSPVRGLISPWLQVQMISLPLSFYCRNHALLSCGGSLPEVYRIYHRRRDTYEIHSPINHTAPTDPIAQKRHWDALAKPKVEGVIVSPRPGVRNPLCIGQPQPPTPHLRRPTNISDVFR